MKQPVYLKAREEILARIARGEITPGQQLPSEDELAAELSTSRASIRNTIMLLEREGILRRRHGIGTFVSRQLPKLRSHLYGFTTVPQLIRSHGYESRMANLSSQIEPGPPKAREILSVAEGENLLRVDRVYLADETPAILCVDYLPTRWRNQRIDLEGFGDELLTHLAEGFGLVIERIRAEITAQNTDEALAATLAVPVGTALLVFEQTGFDRDDTPVTFGYGYHNPAIIQFEAIRHRQPTPAEA